jgi:hypothetical protein
MLETIEISCAHCNTETTAELHSCYVCTKPHHVTEDEYAYVKRDITPLSVIEERAKRQAEIDMYDMLPHIDWTTCFQVEHEQFGVPF